MLRSFSFLGLIVLTACGGSGGSDGASPSNPTSPPPLVPITPTPPSTVENTSFGGILNDVRLANSANPVSYDSRLGTAAQGHSDDMLANDFHGHVGSNGSNVRQRMQAQGYDPSVWAENVAQGYTSQAAVLEGWTNSPDHHANNIDPRVEDFGLGRAGSGSETRWTLVLGAER